MANTVIQLKKSPTPNEVPSNLANGEIALNYADGKLYYKNVTGHIVSISGGGGAGGDNFGTIVANGTLLVADTTNDYLTINQGDNIIIVGDALTDTMTISADLAPANAYAKSVGTVGNTYASVVGDSANAYAASIGTAGNTLAGIMANSSNAYAASLTPDLSPVFVVANAAYGRANDSYSLAQTAFDRANTSNDVLFIVGAYDTANAAFNKANAANLLAYGTGIGANAYASSVGQSANNLAGVMANSSNAYAASLTPDLSPVFVVANASFNHANDAYSLAQTAFDRANTSNDVLFISGAYDTANSAFNKANASNVLAYNANNYANVAYNLAGAAFDRANLSNDVLVIVGAYDTANAAYNKANAANLLAYGTGIGANAYADSVGLSSNNKAGVMANSANAYAVSVGNSVNANLSVATTAANSYAVTVGIAGNTYANAVGTAANSNLSSGTISANNWANTKLSNTSGVMFEGTLNIKTDLSVGNNITTSNTLTFSTASSIAVGEGQVTWNPDESTLDVGLANSSVLQVGQEILYRVKNQTGNTIAQGTVVMAAGTLGASGRILVTPAISNGTYPSKYLMGIATSTIANGGDGYVTHFGKARGLDTSMWSEGDILYANVSVAGGLQNTMPTAPNTKTTVAIVISKHASTGTLFVRPTYGSKLNEDELVELSSLTNGDVLVYNSTPGRFENKVQLALNAGSVNGLTANTIIEAANGYSRVFANSVGTAANANLSVATTSANNYARANAVAVGDAVNANISVATVAANTYARANAVAVGTAVNANISVATVAANAYADTKLANTSGVSFNGNLYFPSGNIGVGSTSASYKIDVVGDVRANSFIMANSAVAPITVVTSANTDQIIDSFANTTWRSAQYVITMKSSTDYHTTQVTLIHDDTNAYITEYGTISTANNLGLFNASVVSGTVRLNVIPTFAVTTINMVRTTNK